MQSFCVVACTRQIGSYMPLSFRYASPYQALNGIKCHTCARKTPAASCVWLPLAMHARLSATNGRRMILQQQYVRGVVKSAAPHMRSINISDACHSDILSQRYFVTEFVLACSQGVQLQYVRNEAQTNNACVWGKAWRHLFTLRKSINLTFVSSSHSI
jgi:hypothetical protein